MSSTSAVVFGGNRRATVLQLRESEISSEANADL